MESLVKINIIKKLVARKNGKGSFPSFKTKMRLLVKGREEEGKIEKWLDVHFNQENVKINELTSGTIEVKQENIFAPAKYEVRENEEGKKEYPHIYIKEIESFTKYKREVQQDDFI